MEILISSSILFRIFVQSKSKTTRLSSLQRKKIKTAVLTCLQEMPQKTLTVWLKKQPALVYEISIFVVNKKESKKWNFYYRKKNKPTDVLSFSYFESCLSNQEKKNLKKVPLALVGELLLCQTVIAQQAKEREITYEEELQRMVVHGVLHLFGYDHERSKKEEKRMLGLQEKIVRKCRKRRI